jgi:hypothetical protein
MTLSCLNCGVIMAFVWSDWGKIQSTSVNSRNSNRDAQDHDYIALQLCHRRSVVEWDTTLQTGRSRVRIPMSPLDFSVKLIFPAELWPWGLLTLLQKWVPGIFLSVKGGRHVTLATSLPCISMWQSRRLTALWASMACYRDSFIYFSLLQCRQSISLAAQAYFPHLQRFCLNVKVHVFLSSHLPLIKQSMIRKKRSTSIHHKKNSMASVCERTIPTERPPLVGEVNANLCANTSVSRGHRNGFPRPYSRISRPQPLFFLPSSSSVVLKRLSGSHSRPTTFQKMYFRRE